ncbi:MAG: uroporphyrinogen decarboxylase family protein [Caldicoprobacterales bacterium]|nr:hypothetical protein [Clostridiales bacterium]
MTQLELFKATIAHEEHDQFLFYANFTPELERRIRTELNIDDGISLRKYFAMYAPVEVNMEPASDIEPPDFSPYFSDIEIPDNAYINGLGVLEIPGSMYHFTRYISPLRNASSLKDIEDFPYPNVEGYTHKNMKEKVEKAHHEGLVTCCSLTHMYEDAWQIRGYQEFLMDMISNQEICHFILDKIMERNLKKAIAAAKAGVDILVTGDDVANQRDLMFSPELWRKFIKCRWATVYQAAKKIKPDIQIWYHSDGNIWDIIPELIEIGVTILNPVQPECLDIKSVKEEFGKYIVIDGTIGTQSTMPFGTPDEVREVIKARKREIGYDGALILSPTHVLEPEVPIENIMAFIEEA